MEIRFLGGALIEAFKASITRTPYRRVFEFASKKFISGFGQSLVQILSIPFVVWKKEEELLKGKSLKQLLSEEYEILMYNWGISLFIIFSLCLSLVFSVVLINKNISKRLIPHINGISERNESISSNTGIKNDFNLPPTNRPNIDNLPSTPNQPSTSKKNAEIELTTPKKANNLEIIDSELRKLIELDKIIQDPKTTEFEKKTKLEEFGNKFTYILKNLSDCDSAKKVYDFAQTKIIPHYGINEPAQKGLDQIKSHCNL